MALSCKLSGTVPLVGPLQIMTVVFVCGLHVMHIPVNPIGVDPFTKHNEYSWAVDVCKIITIYS